MEARQNAMKWLEDPFDDATRSEVKALLSDNGDALEDAFYKHLEFGTGGMRGVMGVGINRVNKYTLGAATQGLANYLRKEWGDRNIRVAIAYDVRHNSDLFGKIVADVLSANGIKVFLFDGPRPTPELSFAVRHLGCHAGIVLTASHNPPEYNGYKVYWADGAQLVPPHDDGVIKEVLKVKYEEVLFRGEPSLIEVIGAEVDQSFVQSCIDQIGFSDAGKSELKVVFTPIHGTAAVSMPPALELAGFVDIHLVEPQMVLSGDFPTVKSPNPEESEAFELALKAANQVGADIILGTDPDADRIGIAVRGTDGKMVLLNGNQTNAVLTDYLLSMWKANGSLSGREFVGTTIVTSDIMFDIAARYGVDCHAVLTGFKWIGKKIKDLEGKNKFVCGGEESYGFLIGDYVRDKDAITAGVLACEVAAYYKSIGSSFYERLLQIYTETSCYQEGLKSLTKSGKSGAEEISQIIAQLRNEPPSTILGSPVVRFDDYERSVSYFPGSADSAAIDLPKSNVLVFFTEDGTRVAVRPSGTEPKIKFYFSVKTALDDIKKYPEVKEGLQLKIKSIEDYFLNLN